MNGALCFGKNMKQCKLCKEFFPETLEFFNSDRQKMDGLCPYCKTCRSKKRKAIYASNDVVKERSKKNALEWFYENRERARDNRKKQYQKNRDKAIVDSRKWREENPDKYKENSSAYSKRVYQSRKEYINCCTRNRRAILSGNIGKHTKKDIDNMIICQSGRCFYCGEILYSYTVDHVIPISRGGSNSPDNLVLACEHCNKSKGARLPEEWIQKPK